MGISLFDFSIEKRGIEKFINQNYQLDNLREKIAKLNLRYYSDYLEIIKRFEEKAKDKEAIKLNFTIIDKQDSTNVFEICEPLFLEGGIIWLFADNPNYSQMTLKDKIFKLIDKGIFEMRELRNPNSNRKRKYICVNLK